MTKKIEELSGQQVNGCDRLANDLAMDSLVLMELAVWLEGEFGTSIEDISVLTTVDDCILAAAGQILQTALTAARAVPSKWFKDGEKLLTLADRTTITDLFLAQAERFPERIVLADQMSGTKTYAQVLTAILVLKPILEKVPGAYIGIMLPASAGAGIIYLASLFSGKIPVMVNWTVGIGNIRHAAVLTEYHSPYQTCV